MTRQKNDDVLNRAGAGFLRNYYHVDADGLVEALSFSSVDQCRNLQTVFSPTVLSELLPRLSYDKAASVLESLDDKLLTTVCKYMDPAVLANVFAQWGSAKRQEKLKVLPDDLRGEMEELLAYPPETVGSIMQSRVFAFTETQTVAHVLKQLRRQKRVITDIYVVDYDKHLIGKISLQKFTIAEPKQQLFELMERQVMSVRALDPISEVRDLIEKTKLMSIPVLDANDILVGELQYKKIFDAVEQDVSMMLQSMVGVSPQERALSNVTFAVKKRLGWLMINLLTTFLAAYIVGLFESTIAKFTALAVLLPVVAGQSGNTGAQALAVISRGLALREIRIRHSLRVILKESTVGALNGVCVGLACAAGVYLWSQSLGLAFVIGLAMVLAMLAAGLSGAAIPMILTALKQDPAQASSIILTTVTDVVGFLSFLGLATIFSSWLI